MTIRSIVNPGETGVIPRLCSNPVEYYLTFFVKWSDYYPVSTKPRIQKT